MNTIENNLLFFFSVLAVFALGVESKNDFRDHPKYKKAKENKGNKVEEEYIVILRDEKVPGEVRTKPLFPMRARRGNGPRCNVALFFVYLIACWFFTTGGKGIFQL